MPRTTQQRARRLAAAMALIIREHRGLVKAMDYGEPVKTVRGASLELISGDLYRARARLERLSIARRTEDAIYGPLVEAHDAVKRALCDTWGEDYFD